MTQDWKLAAVITVVALGATLLPRPLQGAEEENSLCKDHTTSCGTGCTSTSHEWGSGTCFTGRAGDLPTLNFDHCATHEGINGPKHTACSS